MSQPPDGIDWSLTTWEGSRRAQLRQALMLTLRERLQALGGMAEIVERFRWMRQTGKFSTVRPAQAGMPLRICAGLIEASIAPFAFETRELVLPGMDDTRS